MSKRGIEHKIEKIKAFTGIHTRQGLAMYALYVGFGRYSLQTSPMLEKRLENE